MNLRNERMFIDKPIVFSEYSKIENCSIIRLNHLANIGTSFPIVLKFNIIKNARFFDRLRFLWLRCSGKVVEIEHGLWLETF